MNNRVAGYDLIRSIAILVIFLAHIIFKHTTKETLLFLAFSSLSPGLTISLLSFISAALLSAREQDSGAFLIRRFTRIYIPLLSCLLVVLCAHALMGKKVISQHMLIHLMGLSAFFDLFQVQNEATIGYGLWFVTAIIIMYLLLPLLRTLFRHPRGMVHLVSVVILCTVLNGIMYGTSSTWNVVVSFSVGVYLGANGRLNQLIDCDTIRSLSGSLALLGIAALATAGVLPYAMRNLLFAFYPLVFVPLIFSVAKQLPTQILAASGFFATLSYEFYILHFYFIGDNLREFLPIQSGLAAQILMSFFVTFVLAYAISRIAESLRVAVDGYLVRTNTHSSV